MNRLHRLAAASVMAFAVVVGPEQASGQLVVFDPNNYAQNVLTAARALQQINNQIVSLQNQAQMLINQAKNLATLPFSSLLQLEQSIQRTQQLLAQAQRIAYDIQQIDRAFSTTYAPASSSLSDQALIANAQTRWQNAMAGLQDAMRTQATVVGNLNTNRTQMSALVTSSQGATGALQASQAGNQLLALQAQQLADLICGRRGPRTRAKPGVSAACRRSGPGQGATAPLPDPGRRLSTHNRADVSLMNTKTLERLPTVAAVVLVVLVVAACAIRLRGDEDQTMSAASANRRIRCAGDKARGVSLRDL